MTTTHTLTNSNCRKKIVKLCKYLPNGIRISNVKFQVLLNAFSRLCITFLTIYESIWVRVSRLIPAFNF